MPVSEFPQPSAMEPSGKGETRLLRTRRQVAPMPRPILRRRPLLPLLRSENSESLNKKYSGDDWFRSIFYENVPEELFPQGNSLVINREVRAEL